MVTESVFENASVIYEDAIIRNNNAFELSYISFFESTDNLMYVTEKSKTDFFVALKSWWANMVAALTNFVSSLVDESTSVIRKATSGISLRTQHDKIKKADPEAYSAINDVWRIENVYNECIAKASSKAHKIIRMKYRYTSDLEDDIADFNKTIDEYDAKIEELSKTKVKVKNKVLVQFLENEITGRSKVFKNINNSVDELKKIEKEIRSIEIHADIEGADVLEKKIGLFKKMGMKFSNFIHKVAKKIVGYVVFYCNIIYIP